MKLIIRKLMNYPPLPKQKRLFGWTDSFEVSELHGVNENAIQQWLVADIRWDKYCTEDYFPEIIFLRLFDQLWPNIFNI